MNTATGFQPFTGRPDPPGIRKRIPGGPACLFVRKGLMAMFQIHS
ncbi:hypothetical protein CLOSTASPAR_06106 [[Clostridium] asparagiforme DSM 15981]|uniref:Uncharacterized protein n=1 Tax=[Clostridium] asparagiforme DSM 15981 TaxID=518636 RepID=C0DA06_9FIRM|nr:hypothetical protein CLOSTASPAR_06106 [[Clostridium] asparagiforme DSM 15981]